MMSFIKEKRQFLSKILIYNLIPLLILPYLFDSDSMIGKIILVLKFCNISFLYLLNCRSIKITNHVVIGLSCISMCISMCVNGGAGVFLLIVELFMALSVFPVVELSELTKRRVFICCGISSLMVIAYCVFVNSTRALEVFAWNGYLNPNTIGMLFFGACMFFLAALSDRIEKKRWLFQAILLAVTFFLCYLTTCRSALFCLCFVALCLWLSKYQKLFGWVYLFAFICSVVFCFVYIGMANYLFAHSITYQNLNFLGKKIYSGREAIWVQAINGFTINPLFGCGSEYLHETINRYSPHNVFLGILNMMGIVPALAYLYYMLDLWHSARKCSKDGIAIAFVCFTGGLVLAAFECTLTDSRLNFLFLPLLVGGIGKYKETYGFDQTLSETIE